MTEQMRGLNINELDEALQADLRKCGDCHHMMHIDVVVPCGWHENLVASMAAIAAAMRTIDTGTSNDD